MFKNVKSLSVSLDEIVKRERRSSLSVSLSFMVVKDVVQLWI